MLKTFLNYFQIRKTRRVDAETQDALFLACREVQSNIKAAVEFLREQLSTSKAFRQMSWYLVLGAKNTGKTQLISNSELGFLAEDRFVQLTPEGLETKSGVNWWLSPRAVLIDVPGVYLEETTQLTPQRAAWLELLRQIRRYRFRHPLNGIILVIDIPSLQKNLEAGKEMRMRLEEVLYRLKQRLPLYLVVTKMDQIQGFYEYFDDLGQEERDQYSGLTFSLQDKSKTSWAVLFSAAFDELISHLHQRVLWRVHQEWESSKRHVILNFPHQLNALKENLRHLIHELNSLKAHVSLRGVYFTSSLTDGQPTLDYVGETVEKHFALVPIKIKSSFSLPLRSQRAFFIKALFEQKIFPEALLANNVLRATASRQEDFLRWIAVGAGIILLSITLTLSQRYKHQTAHLHIAEAALSDYKLLFLSYNPASPAWDKLLPALDALALARQSAAAADLPWLLRFQLHRQAPLAVLTERLYTEDLQTKLIPVVREEIAQQLEAGENTDSVQLYGLLKVYLMLGDPLHADKRFLSDWFNEAWKHPLMQNPDFRKHWHAAINSQMPVLSNNTTLVQKTRAALNALPYTLLSYAILRNEAPQSASTGISINDDTQSFLLPKISIPTIFTAEAVENINMQINNALYTAINGSWILGDKVPENLSPQALKTLQDNLINDYVENYVDIWQQYISRIQIRPFHSLDQLEQTLQVLTRDHSPLEQILGFIQYNTLFKDTENDALTTVLQNKLNRQFHALNTVSLRSLQSDLQALKLQIQSITHSQTPDMRAWESAKDMASSKNHNPIFTLMQDARLLPEPLKRWLLSIANQSRDFILSKAAFYTWQQWQLQVLPLCHASLEDRYPIKRTAQKEILLSDFRHFFEKGGIFDQFFPTYLSPFVETNTAMWQWKNINGAVLDKDNKRLSQFERAHIIQALYFNDKNQLISAFSLSPHSNGHHKVKQFYTWPVDTAQMTVTLTNAKGEKKHLSRSGDWSIFRLIDAGKLTPHTDGKTYDLIFSDNKDSYKASYTLNTALMNPFVPGVIEQFRCP